MASVYALTSCLLTASNCAGQMAKLLKISYLVKPKLPQAAKKGYSDKAYIKNITFCLIKTKNLPVHK